MAAFTSRCFDTVAHCSSRVRGPYDLSLQTRFAVSACWCAAVTQLGAVSVCLDTLVCVLAGECNAGAMLGVAQEFGGELCTQSIVLADLSNFCVRKAVNSMYSRAA